MLPKISIIEIARGFVKGVVGTDFLLFSFKLRISSVRRHSITLPELVRAAFNSVKNKKS